MTKQSMHVQEMKFSMIHMLQDTEKNLFFPVIVINSSTLYKCVCPLKNWRLTLSTSVCTFNIYDTFLKQVANSIQSNLTFTFLINYLSQE